MRFHGQGTGRSSQLEQNVAAAAQGRVLYVRGIPLDWPVESVIRQFELYGQVEGVNLLPRKAGQRAQAAFVNFWQPEDAAHAACACDGLTVQGNGGDCYWLGCILKQSAHKVDIVRQCFDDAPSEVLDGFLFLGNQSNAQAEKLERAGISHVLSITSKHDGPVDVHPVLERLSLHAEDNEDQDLTPLFTPVCQFLESARSLGGRALVHCIAGRSRSAALVISYLMRCYRMTLADAFVAVKSRRKVILPNVGFWRQLEAEEIRLLGVASQTPLQYRALLAANPPAIVARKVQTLQQGSQTLLTSATRWRLQAAALRNASVTLLADLHADLEHFSSLHGVAAHLDETRCELALCGFSTREAAAEMEQMLAFYHLIHE